MNVLSPWKHVGFLELVFRVQEGSREEMFRHMHGRRRNWFEDASHGEGHRADVLLHLFVVEEEEGGGEREREREREGERGKDLLG